MTRKTRRFILMQAAATALTAPAIYFARQAIAQFPQFPSLSASDALLLRPGDAHFTDYQASFNLRTTLTPQLRALCKTAKAVAVWSIGAAAIASRSQFDVADTPTRGFRKAPALSSTPV